jgi:IclR family pca regulon transcriptional regulator
MTAESAGGELPLSQYGLTASARQTLGIAETPDPAGLDRPAAHRHAITLRLGALEHNASRKYSLASSVTDPGLQTMDEIHRALLVRAVLEQLREEIGYTVGMGALDGTHAVYVHRLFGHQRSQHTIDREIRVGTHVPAHCTALGKVLLASLPDAERRARVEMIDLVPHGPRSIVEQGTLIAELDSVSPRAPVVSDEELVIGARSIAMLVAPPGCERPVAIDVVVPSVVYTVAQMLTQIGPSLMGAARLLSAI